MRKRDPKEHAEALARVEALYQEAVAARYDFFLKQGLSPAEARAKAEEETAAKATLPAWVGDEKPL